MDVILPRVTVDDPNDYVIVIKPQEFILVQQYQKEAFEREVNAQLIKSSRNTLVGQPFYADGWWCVGVMIDS